MLAVKTEEKIVEYAGGDEVIGATIWNSIGEYKGKHQAGARILGFPRLYDIVKATVLQGEFISLTGTPGLGKSMFAYYVALRLLREENIAVIFKYMGWNETHLFLPEVAPEMRPHLTER